MKKVSQALIVFLSVVSLTTNFCLSAYAATITYTADNGIIANPERGPWWWNSNNFGSITMPQPLSSTISILNGLRTSHGLTICVPTYGFSLYKTVPLPQSVLDFIDADFATARTNGYKLIPRFGYTTEHTAGADASATQIAQHLGQLKPIFLKNADVLALGGLGGWGAWGEQGGVDNINGHTLTTNTWTILNAMLDAVPPDHMFMLRYTDVMRSFIGNEPCPESEAFTGTPRSRVGHYNDCYLSDNTSYQTDSDEGPWSYTSVQGQYTPDLAVADPNCGAHPSCQSVTKNLDTARFDFIEPTELGALTGVSENDACVQDVYKKIGYRYRLINATIPDQLKPGNALTVSISMTNDGYDGIFNKRKIEIILRNQSGGAKYILNVIGDDTIRYNRLYLPKSHETKTLTITGGILTTMPAGSYDVLLNMPDPYPSIHDRPEYSIHLANTGVWESTTGYNKLNHTLSVSASGGGTAYSGSSWFSLNGVTAVDPSSSQLHFNRDNVVTHQGKVTYYSLNGQQLLCTRKNTASLPQIIIWQTTIDGRKTSGKMMVTQ